MEEERHYNELTGYGHAGSLGVTIAGSTPVGRPRTTSSPVPTTRPLSPSQLSYFIINFFHSSIFIAILF